MTFGTSSNVEGKRECGSKGDRRFWAWFTERMLVARGGRNMWSEKRFSSWYACIKGRSKQIVGEVKCAGLHFRNKVWASLTDMGIMCIEMVGRRCRNKWSSHEAENGEPHIQEDQHQDLGQAHIQELGREQRSKEEKEYPKCRRKRKMWRDSIFSWKWDSVLRIYQ